MAWGSRTQCARVGQGLAPPRVLAHIVPMTITHTETDVAPFDIDAFVGWCACAIAQGVGYAAYDAAFARVADALLPPPAAAIALMRKVFMPVCSEVCMVAHPPGFVVCGRA